MAWAKVDDQWWSHPKVLGLSIGARGLWVTALSWSCGQRKDVVPTSFVRMVAGDAFEADGLADELVESGLWRRVEGGGWAIHDWADYQDRSLSEVRAEAGRKGAAKRWQTDSKDEAEPPVDQDEQAPEPDDNPIANPLATDGKGDSRDPSLPIPSQREPNGSRQPQRPPKGAGPDELAIHAAFEALFGIPSDTEVGLRRKLAKSILAAGGAADDVADRATAWRHLFPSLPGRRTPTLTAQALDKHWGQLGLIEVAKTFDPEACSHPDDRRVVIDDDAYCAMCKREMP